MQIIPGRVWQAMGYQDIWSNIILCLWGWLCTWLTFKLTDWVKQIALPKLVGLTQSADDLNKTKRLTLPWVKGNSICLTAFELGHCFVFLLFGFFVFSCLQLQTEISALPRPLDQAAPLTPLGVQLADCRSWELPAPRITLADSLE